MDTEVLIVGAGPVGLTLAHELSRRGVDCQVVDRAGEAAAHSRALVVHCRTLELLEEAGLRERFAAQGLPIRGMRFRRGRRLLGRIPFDLGPYPALSLPQTKTEALLREALAGRGVPITWDAELTAMQDSGACVVARVGGQDITARYVIGCDGSRSTVRQLVRIPFEGESLPETVWMADAVIDWDLPADHVWQLLHRDAPMSAIPMPGNQWRVATLRDVDAPAPTPEFFRAAVAKRLGRDMAALDVSWMSEFRVNCRLAAKYGLGRVLLAGDAAHVHSPIGGQGLNVGMQDAFDLANRLSLHLSGSPTDLVASYEAARRPVAHGVIRTNARVTKLATASRPIPRFVGNHVLPNVLRLRAPARRAGLQASGLGPTARRSPDVAPPAPKPSHRNPQPAGRVGVADRRQQAGR